MCRRLYSDNSGEIGAALKELRIMPHNSLPGEPQTNAVAERNNGFILAGARTSLVRAGLPACFWPWAAQHYCLMDNIHFTQDKPSAWFKTHGSEFEGPLVPFGAKVIFRPADTKSISKTKFEEPTVTGVFAGYELTPGYNWSGTFLVWALDDFAGEDLSTDAYINSPQVRHPHRIKRLELPADGVSFPLKAEYDRKNHTLEGATERYLESTGLWTLPGDAEEPADAKVELDKWMKVGKQWYRIHANPRKRLFDPTGVDGGPDVEQLGPSRTTQLFFSNGVSKTIVDDWSSAESSVSQGVLWTGVSIFTLADAPEPPEHAADHRSSSSSSASGSADHSAYQAFDPKTIDRSKPWDGPSPPVPLLGAGGDVTYQRRPDGVWCKKDRCGRQRPVDRNGENWSPPRTHKPDGSWNFDFRPPEVPIHTWWNAYNQAGRKKYWQDKWAADGVGPPPPPVDPPGAPARMSPACSSPGIYGLFDESPSDMLPWSHEQKTDELTDCPSSDDELEMDPESEHSEGEELKEHPCITWETDLKLKGFPVLDAKGSVVEAGQPAVATSAPAPGGEEEAATRQDEYDNAGCMPCGGEREGHRRKITRRRRLPFNAAVARPVRQKEIDANPKAKAAMDKEWDRLRAQYVWDEAHPREWDDVRKEAQRGGYEVHMGYLFGICVEKNSELDINDPTRKFKGRVVFQGDRVVNQNYDAAMFQDLGSAPATMEAAKIADFYGCAPRHCIEVADAVQAYIQAEMKGTPTWVCLPPDARPDWWKKKFPNMRRPVCRLRKALYGHPDAGTYWEQKCDAHCKKVGFVPIGPEWPSCYFHPDLRLLLVVYVDDFKLAGPKANMKRGWELLRQDLDIEPEKVIDSKGAVYLGCRQEVNTIKLPSGRLATAMTYNMEEFLESCVNKYIELAGPGTKIKPYPTPFFQDDHRESPAGAPGHGPVQECPYCCSTFPPQRTWKDVDELEASKRKRQKAGTAGEAGQPAGNQAPHHQDRGRLQPIASRILMKILWAARLARFDLLRAVSHLATFVTKWTSECDRKLHRLIGYIHATKHLRMVGWVGDELGCIKPHLFADADFAGCVESQRSTNGVHAALRGPNTSFPTAGQSKRQGCVSHSTPEAELVATNFALRTSGLPGLLFWKVLFKHQPALMVHEDNQAMIRCVETGKNPSMRYLHRTHRVSVAWLHECFQRKDLTLVYELTSRMCADIYTKAFTDASKWEAACWLINVVDPAKLKDLMAHHADLQSPPNDGGGVPKQPSKTKADDDDGHAFANPGVREGGAQSQPEFGKPNEGKLKRKSSSTHGLTKLGQPNEEKPTNFIPTYHSNDDGVLGKKYKLGVSFKTKLHKLAVELLAKAATKERICLGARRSGGFAHVEAMNDDAAEFMTYLNTAVAKELPQSFVWTSIAIEANIDNMSARSANSEYLKDTPALVILLGCGGACSVHSKGELLVEAGYAMVVDALVAASAKVGQPTGASVHDYIVVKLFQHTVGNKLDGYDRDVLYDYGFKHNLGSTYHPKYEDHGTYIRSASWTDGKYVDDNRHVLVHCCCERGNLLSNPVEQRFGEKLRFLNITKEVDFLTKQALQRVLSSITGPGDMFFYCSPCTGGSMWQNFNLVKALLRGSYATVLKIADHWDLHWRLWAHFVIVARHCAAVGAACVVEWPADCAYWSEDAVRDFLEELGFTFQRFDGCMYGLRPRASKYKTQEVYIRKPWQIACLNTCLPKFLNKQCDHTHAHVPCSGSETIHTQGYTPAIAKLIRQARFEDALQHRRWRSSVIRVAVTLPAQPAPPSFAAAAATAAAAVCCSSPPRRTTPTTSRRMFAARAFAARAQFFGAGSAGKGEPGQPGEPKSAVPKPPSYEDNDLSSMKAETLPNNAAEDNFEDKGLNSDNEGRGDTKGKPGQPGGPAGSQQTKRSLFTKAAGAIMMMMPMCKGGSMSTIFGRSTGGRLSTQ